MAKQLVTMSSVFHWPYRIWHPCYSICIYDLRRFSLWMLIWWNQLKSRGKQVRIISRQQHYLSHPGWRCKHGCVCPCSPHQTSLHRRCGCGLLGGWGWEGCSQCCWSSPEERSWPGHGSALRWRAAPAVEVARWASSSLWRISKKQEVCDSIIQVYYLIQQLKLLLTSTGRC